VTPSDTFQHSEAKRPLHWHWKCAGATQAWTPVTHNQTARPLRHPVTLRNRTATANMLKGQLRASTNVTIGDQAVRNCLHAVNMRLRRRAVRLPLTRAARLAWARRHLAWNRQQWSRVQKQQVTTMDWLDLNPIEHLWDVPGRQLRANHPPAPNLNMLLQILDQEWQAIPHNTLQTLVRSMRHCCVECIQTNGGHTRY